MTKAWLLAALAVVVLGACKKPNPWPRRWTDAERRGWVNDCGAGIPVNTTKGDHWLYYADVRAGAGLEYRTRVCSVLWDPGREILEEIEVDVSDNRASATRGNRIEIEIEPWVEMVAKEVRPGDAAIVRAIARGPEQTVVSPPFVISGGFHVNYATRETDPSMWSLSVSVVDTYGK